MTRTIVTHTLARRSTTPGVGKAQGDAVPEGFGTDRHEGEDLTSLGDSKSEDYNAPSI
jgi:hypothetical protein